MHADNANPSGSSSRLALQLCAAAILLLGLACALWAYLGDSALPDEAGGYALSGGEAYSSSQWDSRSYRRNLEFYGGKSAVLMAEFWEWFDGLWHGAGLAALILVVALAGAGACLHAAQRGGAGKDGPNGP